MALLQAGVSSAREGVVYAMLWCCAGFGAEVVAAISKRCFLNLECPPLRVCGYDTPFPLVFEPVYLPSVQKVINGIHESYNY